MAADVRPSSRTSPSACRKIKYKSRSDTWGSCLSVDCRWSATRPEFWNPAGYLAVDTRHRLLVSPRLRQEFGNGQQFYARAGQVISLPHRRIDRPAQQALEWHLDEIFHHT